MSEADRPAAAEERRAGEDRAGESRAGADPAGAGRTGERRAKPAERRPGRAVLLAAGLLQGLAVLALADLPPNPRSPATEAIALLVLTAGAFVQLTWTGWGTGWGAGQAPARVLAVAVGAAAVPALCLYWTVGHWAGADAPSAWVMLLLASFLALPYVQATGRHGRPTIGYQALYERVVENGLVLAVAGATLLLFVGLRFLWAELFDLLGVRTAADFLEGHGFTSVTDGLMWAIGVILARESPALLGWLRRFAQTVARVMLPVVVTIGASFFAVLPVTGLAPLWEQAGGSRLLLTMAGFAILFINGVYQGGHRYQPGWQRRLVEAGAAILLLAAALSVYGASVRVLQHGLTPDRTLLLASVAIVLLIGAGYALAALPVGGRWFGLARRVNSLAFPAAGVVLLALASPLLDPVRLSAWDQSRRLAGGTVPAETFDYGYLWFRLGEAGKARIAALEALEDHPHAEAIRGGIAEAKSFEDYYAWAARNAAATRLAARTRPTEEPISGPAATVTRSAGFNGARQWDALAVATIAGAGARIHWISEPYEWTVGDAPAVLVPLDRALTVQYRENGSDRLARLAAGDVLRAEAGGVFLLRPDWPTRILVLEGKSIE